MIDRYVILNQEGGWVENVILWDGVASFELPIGTEIKLESEIDYSALPPHPDKEQQQ